MAIPIYIPSGLFAYSMSGIVTLSGYYLFGIYEPEVSLAGILTNVGGGTPRLFEADRLYVYNISNGLFVPESTITASGEILDFTRVGPYTSAICETTTKIVIFQNNGSLQSVVKYQATPVTTSGWLSSTTLSGIRSSDAVSDDEISNRAMPILVGNIKTAGTYPVIYGNHAPAIPYNAFVDSDSGLPQTSPTIAQITDIEAA